MHEDIQRLATNVDIKLTALHRMFEQFHQQSQLNAVNNLRDTVRSAATVISSASTAFSAEDEVSEEIREEFSDFGGWFKRETSQETLNWIYSDSREEPLFDFASHNLVSTPANSAVASQQPRAVGISGDTLILPSIEQATSPSDIREIRPELSTDASKVGKTLSPNSTASLNEERPKKPVKELPPDSPKKRRVSWFRKLSLDMKEEPGTQPKSDNKSNDKPVTLTSPSVEKLPDTFHEDRIVSLTLTKSGARGKRHIRKRLKFVLVGDGACGKTCLLIVATKGTFPEVYVPTVFENYVSFMEVKRDLYEVHLWDTAGQEDYARLRPLSYPDSQGFLICFAIDSPDSLDNVREQVYHQQTHWKVHLIYVTVVFRGSPF